MKHNGNPVVPACPKCHHPQTVKTKETAYADMYLCLACRLIFTVKKASIT